MRGNSQTITVRTRGHGGLSRLRLVYPDTVERPAYDVALARQLLSNTAELPSSKHALLVMLTEYRHALTDLAYGPGSR